MEEKGCLRLLIGSFLILLLVSVSFPVAATPDVEVWLTTGDEKDADNKLTPQESLNFAAESQDSKKTGEIIIVSVDERTSYQEIEGFGAALTDSSAWLLNEYRKNNSEGYSELMSLLFNKSYASGKNYGIGMNYLRLPMGASDFVAGEQFYTYDEVEDDQKDMELLNFTVDHDIAYIIPILQKAINESKDLKILASPWTAPTWMKEEETFYGITDKNKLVRLDRECYPAYAQYFVNFISEYRNHSIPIASITVQNEPLNEDARSYPGMYMNWSEQADFIENHLGPKFVSNNIDTKILIWDHNWDETDFAEKILKESESAKYISGSAWHGYKGNAESQGYVYNLSKDKGIYFTEMSPSQSYPFGTNLNYSYGFTFLPALRNWAKTVMLWNIALNDEFGPHIGGCSDCRGLVTFSHNLSSYKFEAEYYLLAHFSRFIDPGAVRINSTSIDSQLETIAFKNKGPDNSTVLIVLNTSDKNKKEFQVQWKGKHFNYSLDPWSIATFKWNEGTFKG